MSMNTEPRYPHLSDAINLLQHRLESVSEEHAPLLPKWLEDLEKINVPIAYSAFLFHIS